MKCFRTKPSSQNTHLLFSRKTVAYFHSAEHICDHICVLTQTRAALHIITWKTHAAARFFQKNTFHSGCGMLINKCKKQMSLLMRDKNVTIRNMSSLCCAALDQIMFYSLRWHWGWCQEQYWWGRSENVHCKNWSGQWVYFKGCKMFVFNCEVLGWYLDGTV